MRTSRVSLVHREPIASATQLTRVALTRHVAIRQCRILCSTRHGLAKPALTTVLDTKPSISTRISILGASLDRHTITGLDDTQNTRTVLDTAVELVVASRVEVARISVSFGGVVAVVGSQSVTGTAKRGLVASARHVAIACCDVLAASAEIRSAVTFARVFDTEPGVVGTK